MLTELSIGIQDLTQATIGKIQRVKSFVKKSIDAKVNFFGRILEHANPIKTASQQSSRNYYPLRVVWMASLLLSVRGQRSAPFPAQFELSSLDGINGFIINGEYALDYSGYSVSSAGDVNGDGISDIIIGAQHNYAAITADNAKSYVLFGSRSMSSIGGKGGILELSSLNGVNGFILNGEAVDEDSSISVSSAGDVNGDGLGDLLIGTSYATPTGKLEAGKSYVIFGSRSFSSFVGGGGSLELSSLQGTNGFILNGENMRDNSGFSVSSAGDVNGDGLADIVIGAYSADPKGRVSAGKSYVVFGSSSFSSLLDSGGNFELSSLNGTNGFILDGEAMGDNCGRSVSSAGDVNGDGLADIVIGAYGAEPPGRRQAGKSYVLFGSRSFSSVVNNDGSFDLSSLNGANGFILLGEEIDDYSGCSVSSAGDVNGDGLADIVIGAYLASLSGRLNAGKSYVLYGSRSFSSLLGSGNSLELSSLNGAIGVILNGEAMNDRSGFSVSSAGDLNDDGLEDLVIGAYRARVSGRISAGKSYVLFGSRRFSSYVGSGNSIELSSLNGTNGFILNGESGADESGFSVSSAGDVNGDGVTDLLIGAKSASQFVKTRAGKTYVIFGRNLAQTISTKHAPFTSSLPVTTLSRSQQSKQTQSTANMQQSGTLTSTPISTKFSTPSSQLTSDAQSSVVPIVMAGIGVSCLSGVVVAVIVYRKCKKPDQESDHNLNQLDPDAHAEKSNGIYEMITLMPTYESGDIKPDDFDSVRSVPLESKTMNIPQTDYIEIQLPT